MRCTPVDPPRIFTVGKAGDIRLKDCAEIALEPDEQVTFTTASGARYDVARKSWGFYATPSLNRRLPASGLRAALVRSRNDAFYVMLVEDGRDAAAAFHAYLDSEDLRVVAWLWDGEALRALADERGRRTHGS
jgi:hypothetical protein